MFSMLSCVNILIYILYISLINLALYSSISSLVYLAQDTVLNLIEPYRTVPDYVYIIYIHTCTRYTKINRYHYNVPVERMLSIIILIRSSNTGRYSYNR